MEFIIQNPSFFYKSLALIAEICDEGYLVLGRTFKAFGLDPARNCVFHLELGDDEAVPKSTGPEQAIGISYLNLHQIITRMKSAKEISIRYSESTRKFKITSAGNVKKTYTMSERTVDNKLEEDRVNYLLSLNTNTIIKIDVSKLMECVKDVELVSDYVTFTTKPNSLLLGALSVNGECWSEIETGENYTDDQASYSVMYLNRMNAFIGEQTIVKFSTDYLMFFLVKLSAKSKFTYAFGPRVENESQNEDDIE